MEGLAAERFYHHESQPCERVDDDEQDRDRRGHAGHRSDLGPRDLGQGSAVAAHREGEDQEVLHGSGEHDADDEPEETGEIAELRGQHGPHERPRPTDRCEMVAEEDPPVGRVVVVPVIEPVRRRHPQIVQDRDLGRQERRVVAVGDREQTEDTDDQGQRVYHAVSLEG